MGREIEWFVISRDDGFGDGDLFTSRIGVVLGRICHADMLGTETKIDLNAHEMFVYWRSARLETLCRVALRSKSRV